ncbi:MAG: glycoside hydrolase, family 3-like protein [Alphaproteobacteria bacterium]|jgi:beta-N-acetylhexosaminidase|nr:glycoside hydrolase, family 3-like protein [Alphaproteobacteria bacterium]
MQLTDLKAIIIDATGTELTKEEQDLLKSERPAGFILFKRNCVSKQQVKDLVASVRECVGWDGLPVLIDQEGGTVSRLKQPEWKEYPAAKIFGELATASEQEGRDAARINSYLMALDLADLGISVNCAPVVDVPAPDCHEFLSASRTYSDAPEMVGLLGEAVCRGLLEGGITPVIKHIPGHGRAKVDSHLALPSTDAPLSELSKTDFKPFKYLSQTDMKTAVWAMAAHVVFSSVDPDSAATLSTRVVEDVIRDEIGFNGVLLADDISMKALGGTLESRVKGSMASGMDLTMLCNATFDDRKTALNFTPKLTARAAKRVADAEAQRTKWLKKGNDNRQELQAKLEQLIEKRRIG